MTAESGACGRERGHNETGSVGGAGSCMLTMCLAQPWALSACHLTGPHALQGRHYSTSCTGDGAEIRKRSAVLPRSAEAQPEQELRTVGFVATQQNWDGEHISALKQLPQSLTGQAVLQCTRHHTTPVVRTRNGLPAISGDGSSYGMCPFFVQKRE